MVGFDQEYKYKNLPKSNHPESMAITKLTTVKALYCKICTCDVFNGKDSEKMRDERKC